MKRWLERCGVVAPTGTNCGKHRSFSSILGGIAESQQQIAGFCPWTTPMEPDSTYNMPFAMT